nr:MAG TPA: hypothetical protein [Caudoviricetes sp.]
MRKHKNIKRSVRYEIFECKKVFKGRTSINPLHRQRPRYEKAWIMGKT